MTDINDKPWCAETIAELAGAFGMGPRNAKAFAAKLISEIPCIAANPSPKQLNDENGTDCCQSRPFGWQFIDLTVRDYFAAKAMLAADLEYLTDEDRASRAYCIADAMIAARGAA